jgi:argininosuccinate lyase
MKKKQTNTIWAVGNSTTHPLVEAYTAGDDYVLDQKLLSCDIQASIAHAEMLKKIGVLTAQELRAAKKGLAKAQALWKEGKFTISQAQEDGHTALEQFLTENFGDVGKKIHTGRSRNDQALVMTRLYMKEKLAEVQKLTKKLENAFAKKGTAMKYAMPGYTHMQKAMPTTVQVWLNSYADALKDAEVQLLGVQQIIDQNPLGSASGFGIANFKLDRAYTTRTLGFKKTQENPLYCGMSRGYFEHIAMQAMENFMLLAGKFANDMMLFTTQEFGFFSLPEEFTTGSSIMPQKRNYDLFEIMRGNVKVFSGYHDQVRNIVASLGSGYHRDYQLTKKPFVLSVELCITTLELLVEVVGNIKADKEKLAAAMTDDLFATEKVYALVKKGMSFRDAYVEVKKQLR